MPTPSTLFRLFLTASLFSLSLARLWSRSSPPRSKNNTDLLTSSSPSNGALAWGSDPEELVKRDGSKYVFMHHIVGNTYPYTASDWEKDIREIQAKGIDAIALNIGASDWEKTQIDTVYRVAQSMGASVKLFYSFDFTEMRCSLDDIVARIKLYANHPNQFKLNGKVFVSSYGGDCLGNIGWASLKSQTNAYVMPFMWGQEGNFARWTSLDSWYCWGCAWPQGNHDTNTDDDDYCNQLGTKYAATIGPWMFTHYSFKNFYLRGDDWLLNSRWEQIIAMRNQLNFVELLTWNDYGESNYLGTVRGAQPVGTYWADAFPHTAWFDMSEYYIKAFQTGTYPPITKDVVYFWSKPHPSGAVALNDAYGRPTGWDWSLDYLWAAVFATSSAQVTLKMGSSSQTFNVGAGVSKLKLPAAVGTIQVTMTRGGKVIANAAPTDFIYILNPVRYNYNAYVGAAVAPASGSTTTTSSSPPTSASTTSATPSTTSVSGVTWYYRGCYDDSPYNHILANGLSVSQGSNTISACLHACAAEGYAFGGVEYGRECYCSAKFLSNAALKPDGQCNMPCAGNAGEMCGNGNRIAIYSAPSIEANPPAPSTTSVAGSIWTWKGCYSDDSAHRTLSDGGSTSSTANTITNCLATCASRGYAFGGVEYAKECYCGTQIRSGLSPVPIGQCNMACAGNGNEKCGDANRVGVYSRSL